MLSGGPANRALPSPPSKQRAGHRGAPQFCAGRAAALSAGAAGQGEPEAPAGVTACVTPAAAARRGAGVTAFERRRPLGGAARVPSISAAVVSLLLPRCSASSRSVLCQMPCTLHSLPCTIALVAQCTCKRVETGSSGQRGKSVGGRVQLQACPSCATVRPFAMLARHGVHSFFQPGPAPFARSTSCAPLALPLRRLGPAAAASAVTVTAAAVSQAARAEEGPPPPPPFRRRRPALDRSCRLFLLQATAPCKTR